MMIPLLYIFFMKTLIEQNGFKKNPKGDQDKGNQVSEDWGERQKYQRSHWLQIFAIFSLLGTNVVFRGTQQQVSVDICSVEGSSPWVFDVDQRVHSDFR